MATTLAGKRIAFLVAPEGAEQVELTEPWKAVEEAGGTPELVSTEVGKIQAFNHLTPADTFEADKAADSVTASDTTAWCCRAAWRIPTSSAARHPRCSSPEASSTPGDPSRPSVTPRGR